jgi:hypothetical protein
MTGCGGELSIGRESLTGAMFVSPELPSGVSLISQQEMSLAAVANMTYICTKNKVFKEVFYG